MLGRLIQTAASYGRGNATLESATEESHTRNLLYGQSNQPYQLAQSPPSSPHASQTFRPGAFDDRGGLELEEKDVRILIAQDAFGVEEKPTLLFDSTSLITSDGGYPSASHARHSSMADHRSPIPGDWKAGALAQADHILDSPFRSRSNTLTSGANTWSRPVRDTATREDAFLECMFGVTSSTKAASTTKMHLVPGRPKIASKRESRSRHSTDFADQGPRRAPLHRSRTSNTLIKSSNPMALGVDTETYSQDAILVTRLFSVTLSETVAPTPRTTDIPASPSVDSAGDEQSADSPIHAQTQNAKKPKLVERKVPAFAIGLIISLPRTSDVRSSSVQNRPASRSAIGNSISSASSSYGSDMQASWTFLNAIPESLASSTSSGEDYDRRIETIVANEDVLLRAIAALEAEATRIIHKQLQKVLNSVTGPVPKTPKEKSMQRINQRVISITDAAAVSKVRSLREAAKHTMRRVIYALRIPRVVCGLGFGGGHWTDEARAVFRICGRRQQNFFLFTLLTAFLGSHTQWLQRLAPEWYQRQHKANSKQHKESFVLSQRTVIVSDQRTVARRLIFLLASFIPGFQGFDGLQKPGEDFLALAPFSASSPSSHLVRNESLRRTANRRMRESRLQSISHDRSVLSTSVESTDSAMTADRPRRYMVRKDSDGLSIRGPSALSVAGPESQLHKPSIGTTSGLSSHPATPVPVFSTRQGTAQDDYFSTYTSPTQSVATAGLANILRRSSSSFGNSSNVSSRWGSLVSGLSDLLGNKQLVTGDSGSATANSSAVGSSERRSVEFGSGQRKSNALQDMVNQLEADRLGSRRSLDNRLAGATSTSPDIFLSPTKQFASMPRLRVDDKDGVVDVDLDLPGFAGIGSDELFKSPTRSATKFPMTPRLDAAESIRSVKINHVPTFGTQPVAETNVAGYLKWHHDDFSLHAVRPYPDLEEDIRKSMTTGPSAPILPHHEDPTIVDDGWLPICSTVVADMRTFSIRRITLKRKVESPQDISTQIPSPSNVDETGDQPTKSGVEETIFDEEIKDFDTALADAIEKVLDINETAHTQSESTPRYGHSRTASSGTVNSTSHVPPRKSIEYAVPKDYAKQDCRQVVLGALEDIVKDVCNELSQLEMGRDIHCGGGGAGHLDPATLKSEMKQENALRRGVRHWLLNLEQPRVC